MSVALIGHLPFFAAAPVKRFYHQLGRLRLAREAEHPRQEVLPNADI